MGMSRERLRGRGFWGYFKMSKDSLKSIDALPKGIKNNPLY